MRPSRAPTAAHAAARAAPALRAARHSDRRVLAPFKQHPRAHARNMCVCVELDVNGARKLHALTFDEDGLVNALDTYSEETL